MNCGKEHPPETHSRCQNCGGVLETNYNLEGDFHVRPEMRSIWDFSEFLPPVKGENVVSLGEGWTPYVKVPKLTKHLGLSSVRCKIEGSNPTGSFKDRAMSVGVSLARQWRKNGIYTASDGNAGAATAAYSAAAGIRCLVMLSEDVPRSKVGQISMYTPFTLRVGGLYQSLSSLEAGLSQAGRLLPDWLNMFAWAPFNPLMVDANKTIAYEIALSKTVPDFVVVPTAGGDLLYGLYKGFAELREMGLIERSPRLVVAQGEGADPAVKALETGVDRLELSSSPRTVAGALAVNFVAEHPIRAVKETQGFGISVSDDSILEAQRELAREERIFCEISSAVAIAAIKEAVGEGRISKDQTAAAVLTGFGLKDFPSAAAGGKDIPLVESISGLPSAITALLSRN
jgi:threonine synthase